MRVEESLAINLQRLFRGMNTRMKMRMLRYQRLNQSVKTIQRCYRKFKMFQFARMRRSHVLKDDTVTGNWKEVISGHGTFEERMVMWRAIIELRRAHPSFNTDLCIRAMTLAEGDIQRALVLIGYPEFYMKFQAAPDIPKYLRDCFLPSMVPGSIYLAPPSTTDGTGEAQPAGLGHSKGKVNSDRNVKAQKVSSVVCPGGIDFAEAINMSYFSNKFVGNTQTATQQKIKAQATKGATKKRTKNPLKKSTGIAA